MKCRDVQCHVHIFKLFVTQSIDFSHTADLLGASGIAVVLVLVKLPVNKYGK